MKPLPVMDNDMETAGDGIKRRHRRIMRIAAIRAPWSALQSSINAWFDGHMDAAVLDIDTYRCEDGSFQWHAIIWYYEDMKACP